MNARLSSSTKWTNFPKELTEQIVEIFQSNFGARVQNADFIAEGRIYPKEVALRVGFVTQGRLKQNNFEASMDYDPKTLNADEMIPKLVDITGAFLESFLEAEKKGEELDLPREWQKHNFDKQLVYLKYSTVNTDLEAQADKLLGFDESSLVEDSDERSEDALDHAPTKIKITKKDS